MLRSDTMSLRPSMGPAALMTDTPQDLSKHRMEPLRVTTRLQCNGNPSQPSSWVFKAISTFHIWSEIRIWQRKQESIPPPSAPVLQWELSLLPAVKGSAPSDWEQTGIILHFPQDTSPSPRVQILGNHYRWDAWNLLERCWRTRTIEDIFSPSPTRHKLMSWKIMKILQPHFPLWLLYSDSRVICSIRGNQNK